MKKRFKFLKASTLFVLLMIVQSLAFAQVSYKIEPTKSSVVVAGTSTLHDWEMNVETLQASFDLAEAASIKSLSTGQITIEVESLKSEHSLMDKKTYEALKSDKNPQIKVKLLDVSITEPGKGIVKIALTIAGKTQQVADDFSVEVLANQALKVQGELDLKLTSYDVEPPVALMGTIKTGDDIKIAYNLVFKAQ